MTKSRVPVVFPPGDLIREELDARGWTQGDLAAVLGRPTRLVNELLAGKRTITPETAQGLAEAFGTSAEFWMNLETQYQLYRTKRPDAGVARRSRLYSVAPVKEMQRRGWIATTSDVDEVESHICAFYGVNTIDDVERTAPLAHAAKKSTACTEPLSPAQRAWVTRVRQLGAALDAAPYVQGAVTTVCARLRQVWHTPEEVRHVPRLLAEAGIRLVVVEPLSGTRIDGVCTWLDPWKPVIGLSIRFDRIDSFWFALLHELGHVDRRDGIGGSPVVDVDMLGDQAIPQSDKPEYEQRADHFASTTLVQASEIDGFIARKRPLFSRIQIQGFAKRLGVHPGIVIGQLQHRGEIRYSHSRDLLVRIRAHVTASALTDGWGSHPGA